MRFTSAILFLLLLTSCYKQEDVTVEGMKPVYISQSALLAFEQMPPQPLKNSGKSMLYSHYLFLGEVNEGIHIIDIADTLNPSKISFLKIPGNKDMVSQNGRLYADNGPHLLILNIDDIYHVTIVSRNLNAFEASDYFPPLFNGYFECADYNNGWVVDWEKTKLLNPKCIR